MASEVDISNLALSHLGDVAQVVAISPPDGTVQAEHCARFYPMSRDITLESRTWNFAIKRKVLADLGSPPQSWLYRYARPSACIRLLAVLQEDSVAGDDTEPFIEETQDDGTRTILTDVPIATLRYISAITDTTKFSPLFTGALSWKLASFLAGPILKGKQGIQVADYCEKQYVSMLGMASTSDASTNKPKSGYVPSAINAR